MDNMYNVEIINIYLWHNLILDQGWVVLIILEVYLFN
jgi:hypothetical protein